MPDKQKMHNWKDPKTIIATASITAVLTLWNVFATSDRLHTGTFGARVSTPRAKTDKVCPPSRPVNAFRDEGKKCVSVTRTQTS